MYLSSTEQDMSVKTRFDCGLLVEEHGFVCQVTSVVKVSLNVLISAAISSGLSLGDCKKTDFWDIQLQPAVFQQPQGRHHTLK